jgi:dTDP-glucose pyrophosphorylase
MLNIVVPMAGRGSRFVEAGYLSPKPLIQVGGKPMVQWVVENVRPSTRHRFIFICLAEHLRMYPEVAITLKSLCDGCEIIEATEVTQGAACTVLLARQLIDNCDPLMIVNADQIVEMPIDSYLAAMEESDADGLIMTFWSDHPKWSYCKMRPDGTVAQLVEKQVVSNDATVGIYNFRRGKDYVRAADSMIAKNLRVNNEFYVAPTYNELISGGARIVVCPTGREYDGMFGLGIPNDLEFFLTSEVYRRGRSTRMSSDYESVELTRKRTEIYARFFNDKNLAGLRAIMDENIALTDPNGSIRGRDEVMSFSSGLFSSSSSFAFRPLRVIAELEISVIEFELILGSEKLVGADIVRWTSDNRIASIDAYLYEANGGRHVGADLG